MEHSPSSEAASFSANQQTLRTVTKPNTHYRAHNSQTFVSIFSHINPIQTHSSHLGSILIVYCQLHLGLLICLFPSDSPTKNPVYISTHTCHTTQPAQPLLIRPAEVIDFLLMQSN
jgi:hypothetical protein